MADKATFGNSGGSFLARVALPGYDVEDTDLTHFALHEQHNVARPVYKAKHTVSADAEINFTVTAVVGKIFYAILKSDEGYIPQAPELYGSGPSGAYFAKGTFHVRIRPSDGYCRLINELSEELNITLAIFAVEATT